MYEQWDHTYRLRPYFRNVGIVCTSLFLCALVGSVLAAYFNIEGSFARPALAIAFFSVVFGSFTLLGVWLILAYLKYRLFLNDNAICQVGVLQTKSIALNAIHELKWRLFPQGGSCVLTSLGTKLKIEFNNFTNAEKAELITYLHQSVASDRQTNWDHFHDRFLVNSPERARQQQSSKRILILAIFGFAAVFGVAWISGRGFQYLVISIVNLLVGAWAALRDRGAKNAA
ncbi:MAG: hypothetical protein KDA44_21005 [Planctomycetales bacterium]|nr:hypothetical protein [Planctomycetales bacterium]